MYFFTSPAFFLLAFTLITGCGGSSTKPSGPDALNSHDGDAGIDDMTVGDIDLGSGVPDLSGPDLSSHNLTCCSSSTPCSADKVCVSEPGEKNVCKPKVKVSGFCWSDADCPGSTCVGAAVCPCDEGCPGSDHLGKCAVVTGCCLSSDDCNGNECVGANANGLNSQGLCETVAPPSSCWSNADCSKGSICSGGSVCRCGDSSCDHNTQHMGTCVLTAGCCSGPGDCPGKVCVGASANSAGTCQDPLSSSGSCWSGDDCTGGLGCINAHVCACGDTSCDPNTNHSGTCGSCKPGTCARNQFCNISGINMCNATGTCTAKLSTCRVGAPVCGCDGKNYPKTCEANKVDVPVLKNGQCDLAPGYCYDDTNCTSAEECVNASSGAFSLDPGVCKPKPIVAGTCWSDADVPGSTCDGAAVCGFGESCNPADDTMGTYTVPSGCCYLRGDCGNGGLGEECTPDPTASGAGLCKQLPATQDGTCWTPADCPQVARCNGLTVCSCNDLQTQSCDPTNDKKGTCILGSGTCCNGDGDCHVSGEHCYFPVVGEVGVCKPPPAAGQCWTDDDCPGTCMGAAVLNCVDTTDTDEHPGTCM